MDPPFADITGHWDINVRFFNGEGKHEFFIEKQDGNWVQGVHLSGFSRQVIDGTVEGKQVKLQSTYSAPGDSIPFIFSGTLDKETISGTLYMGKYRTAEFTASTI